MVEFRGLRVYSLEFRVVESRVLKLRSMALHCEREDTSHQRRS